jgi:hypothetical protein
MRRILGLFALGATVVIVVPPGGSALADSTVQFVFTSDAHYGLTRRTFRGSAGADAHVVNAAMITTINSLPNVSFSRDGGLRTGERVGAIDFLVEGGDITNREEGTGPDAVQRASVSWSQFRGDYIEGLTVKGRSGAKAALFIIPGNHDISNAIGFYRPMTPTVDSTSMVEIYNRMMAPRTPRTTTTYDYNRDKVLFSRDIGGIHFMFLNVWPDSTVRAWIENDLKRSGHAGPVILFAHDAPDVASKHFRNPNGRHDINADDRFENVLSDEFADGTTTDSPAFIEWNALEEFFRKHPNITAYFHGDSNWNQFYDWTGPHHTVAVHTFRVDSPMKGAVSSNDETRLSFQVVTIDAVSRKMTVRECLWNIDPAQPSSPVQWGGSTTVALAPRPTPARKSS